MCMKKKMKNSIKFLILFAIVFLCLVWFQIGCPIKYITGISCPGCGMTRAWLSALHLQFHQAFLYHPLFWCVPMPIILYFLWDPIPNKIRNVLITLLIVLILSVYVYRLFFKPDYIVCIDVKNGAIWRVIRWIIN